MSQPFPPPEGPQPFYPSPQQPSQPLPPPQYSQPIYPQPLPYVVQPVYVQTPQQPVPVATWWNLMPWWAKALFILGLCALTFLVVGFCIGVAEGLGVNGY